MVGVWKGVPAGSRRDPSNIFLNRLFLMTAIEPNVADTGRYSVKEASNALGIHRNTLERYRKAQRIHCGWRMTTGRKYYTGAEIKKLWRTI